jgi:hypothetical protein
MKLFLLVILNLILTFSTFAETENIKKLALVIGNSNYGGINQLTNPVNDATSISQSLRRIGFEVIEKHNLNLKQMRGEIKNLIAKLDSKTLVVFFYAGHAAQVQGANYLQPLNADIEDESDMSYEAFNLNQFLMDLQSVETYANIIMLDSCRNNPYLRRSFRGELNQGLAEMSAPLNTLISFSTRAGQVASDGLGEHSPYTTELLKHIEEPNLSITSMLQKVRAGVSQATFGAQIPTETSLLLNNIYLNFNEQVGETSPTETVRENPAKKKFQTALAWVEKNLGKTAMISNNLEVTNEFQVNSDCSFRYTSKRKYKYIKAPDELQQFSTSIICEINSNLKEIDFVQTALMAITSGDLYDQLLIYMNGESSLFECKVTLPDDEVVTLNQMVRFSIFSNPSEVNIANKAVDVLADLKSSCLEMNRIR